MTEELTDLIQRINGQLTIIAGRIELLDKGTSTYVALKGASGEAANLIRQIQLYLANEGLLSPPPQPTLENVVYRIVHVDDEESIRGVVRNILTASEPSKQKTFEHPGRVVSYTIESYGSVDEALAAISQDTRPIDLLLTDRLMNGSTGFDLFERISGQSDKTTRKQEYAHVKNIAMFSSGMKEADIARARSYGAIVIEKPITSGAEFEKQVYLSINKPQS